MEALCPQRPLTFNIGDLKFQIVVLKAHYDEIELQKIVITSFQWRFFVQFGHFPIKISGYANENTDFIFQLRRVCY